MFLLQTLFCLKSLFSKGKVTFQGTQQFQLFALRPVILSSGVIELNSVLGFHFWEVRFFFVAFFLVIGKGHCNRDN